jgi:hypothetical protein
MLFFVTREDHSYTIKRLLKSTGGKLGFISSFSYEELFFIRSAPSGHYIFSDFDRLSPFEIEIAISLADALENHSKDINIYNNPRSVLERYPLLKKLNKKGINQFTVTRLDGEDMPTQYPVFIRSEDGCQLPDTDLIHTKEELLNAIKVLRIQGRSLKRRIAVGFCAERDSTGFYRKYGAFNINGTIVPQHILRGDSWVVKNHQSSWDDKFVDEELAYITNNPHREPIRRVFDLAGIDFGRIDYTIVDGAIQVFEVNTNPSFPNFTKDSDGRGERRNIISHGLVNAFKDMNTPLSNELEMVRFEIPRPYIHSILAPKQRRIRIINK